MAYDPTIWAGILLIFVILVIVYFLWKTQKKAPQFDEEDVEQAERPSYERVFRCPKCESQVDWDTPECPECGIDFEDDAFVCPKCGAGANPADMECDRCGLVFLEEAFVCPNCKHAVEYDSTKCPRCKENYWSPLRLPSKARSEMVKVEKEKGPDDSGKGEED